MRGNSNAITDPNHIGNLNPFRYRGYYYDSEIGFYYLMSRYYDPITHRFINADGYFQSGGNILDINMSAYCGNNPINRVDYTGEFWGIAFLVIAVITIVCTFTADNHQTIIDNKNRKNQIIKDKYNDDTIHIYTPSGDKQNEKINILIDESHTNEKGEHDPNIKVFDSYKIQSKEEIVAVIDYIFEVEEFDNTVFTRSKSSYANEWLGHNTMFNISSFLKVDSWIKSSKDVDMNLLEDRMWIWDCLSIFSPT